MIGVVGAPERRELAVEEGAFVGELRRTQPIDRIGARLAPDLHELVADLVDRDFPGNPGPLAVHHFHRIAQAAIAMHQFARRRALGAVRAAIDRRIPARLLADPDAVRHFRHQRAADRAVRADVLADGGAGDLRAGRFRLADGAERQRAERGQTAGHQAGTAQEGTTVETADRLTVDCRCETAATCLSF